jgi:hypothetical protein
MRLILLLLALVSGGGAWNDPSGDAPGGADITRVTASAAAGSLTLTIQTSDAASWENTAAIVLADADGVPYMLTFHSLHDLFTVDRTDTQQSVKTTGTATLAGAVLTIVVPLAELGSPKTISFLAETRGPSAGDDAGRWTVSTAAPPRFAPAKPVHGRLFSVSGAASCSAKLRGKTLPGSCRWKVPAGARGATLTVVAGGHAYRFRVR